MSNFGRHAARLSGAAGWLLGWRPDDFWDATPTELAIALRPDGDAGEPLDRATMNALQHQFPDCEATHG